MSHAVHWAVGQPREMVTINGPMCKHVYLLLRPVCRDTVAKRPYKIIKGSFEYYYIL
jgi:hypothetical protein